MFPAGIERLLSSGDCETSDMPATSQSVRRPAVGSLAITIAACLLLTACATTAGTSKSGQPAASPSTGATSEDPLGLTGPEVSPALQAIATAPYAVPADVGCDWLSREVESLDRLLGADVDAPRVVGGADDMVGRAAVGAIRGLIPYRGVLRWMTRANAKEQDKAHAVLAAAARRGYLKGLQHALNCTPPVTPLPAK
jgi:hypothetical protein